MKNDRSETVLWSEYREKREDLVKRSQRERELFLFPTEPKEHSVSMGLAYT